MYLNTTGMRIGPEFVPKVLNCLQLERVTEIITYTAEQIQMKQRVRLSASVALCIEMLIVYKCTQFVPKGLSALQSICRLLQIIRVYYITKTLTPTMTAVKHM